jgi:hypothetical protein
LHGLKPHGLHQKNQNEDIFLFMIHYVFPLFAKKVAKALVPVEVEKAVRQMIHKHEIFVYGAR